jgi:hypothetical protein
MDHDILKTILFYVVLASGLLAITKFVLSEVGDFWKWFKQWKGTL